MSNDLPYFKFRSWSLKLLVFAVGYFWLAALGGEPALAEDWPMIFHDPGRTGASLDKKVIRPPFRILWRYPIPDGFGSHGSYDSKPIVADGVVYVTGLFHESNKEKKKSKLIALDALKGTLIWEKEGGFATPAVSEGILYTVQGKKCFAFEAKSGQLKWSADIASVSRGWPTGTYLAINDSLLYIVGGERIVALNAKTGEQTWEWSYQGEIPRGFAYYGLTIPAIDRDGVYFVNGNAEVVCLDARKGTVRWKNAGIVRKETGHPTWCFTMVADGVLIIGSDAWLSDNQPRLGQRVYALSTKDGSLIWQRGVLCGGKVPTMAKGVLYMTSSFGEMLALDARTGAYIWDRYKVVGVSRACGGLYYGSGLLYYFTGGAGGTREVGFLILDAKGGKVLWYSRLVDESDSANWWTCGSACGGPSIANGILYLSTSVKGILALVPDKGQAKPESEKQ